jgi:hypothetical protein
MLATVQQIVPAISVALQEQRRGIVLPGRMAEAADRIV